MPLTMYQKRQYPTLIIPMGMLLKLNLQATGAAFIKSAAEGKLQPGASLDLKILNELMPQILEVDKKFKTGYLTSEQFRQAMQAILKLNLTDDEFDQVWNAMLGDINKLKNALEEFHLYCEIRVALISETNPIHYAAIKKVAGTLLEEFNDVFLSYQSKNPSDLYSEAFNTIPIDPWNSYIVLKDESDVPSYPDIKARDQKHAKNLKEWAKENHLNVILVKPGQDVIAAIKEELPEKYKSGEWEWRPEEIINNFP